MKVLKSYVNPVTKESIFGIPLDGDEKILVLYSVNVGPVYRVDDVKDYRFIQDADHEAAAISSFARFFQRQEAHLDEVISHS